MKEKILKLLKEINYQGIDNGLWCIYDHEIPFGTYTSNSYDETPISPHIALHSDAELGDDVEQMCDFAIPTEYGVWFIYEL